MEISLIVNIDRLNSTIVFHVDSKKRILRISENERIGNQKVGEYHKHNEEQQKQILEGCHQQDSMHVQNSV